MKIVCYIDGFNLYYGALKNTGLKWLDISKMCRLLFPSHSIEKVKYFTAPVRVRKNDLDADKPNRQQVYLRALRTLKDVEIIQGFFLTHDVMMMRSNGKGFVEVIKTEEKGTDVNLAAHLLHDGHLKKYEMAVVISNDSDLAEPIKLVTKELKLPVVVVSPFPDNKLALASVASGVKTLRHGLISVSQLPKQIVDDVGQITPPPSWI